MIETTCENLFPQIVVSNCFKLLFQIVVSLMSNTITEPQTQRRNFHLTIE